MEFLRQNCKSGSRFDLIFLLEKVEETSSSNLMLTILVRAKKNASVLLLEAGDDQGENLHVQVSSLRDHGAQCLIVY